MILREAIGRYILWRQAHGAKFTTGANLLRRFLDHADGDAACDAVTTGQVLVYLAGKGPPTRHRENKYYALAGFWRHAISRGHATQWPMPDDARRSPVRAPPYIYSRDELARLFDPATVEASRRGAVQLDAVTFRTLLLVLYGAGLRFGEATRLTLADVDLANAVLTIRATKFYKSRLVPVGPQLAAVLDSHVFLRQRAGLVDDPNALLLANQDGTRLASSTVQAAFDALRRVAGVSRAAGGRKVPRLHDLRHSFAVHSLTSWYRQGADVQRLLPVLSTYLGHADLEGTKVYLSMTPELLEQASLRFARYVQEVGMSDLAILGPWLRRFLTEHIVTERNLARNTRKSYRDTFSLLLPFVSQKVRKPVDRLAVWDLTSRHVLQFLAHLETDRGCTARTRNQRLATIRAFARFVGSRDPTHVEWCGHIRAIASKRSMPPPVGWLTRAEMEAMLATPDRKTRRGRSEYALLLFLYNTGARVSEATQLRVRDLQIGSRNGGHDLATLHGKGGRTRQCPLWPETERALVDEVIGRTGEDAVFVSRLGTPFTRFGVYRLIERCAAQVPELANRTITPHVIRHTTACHLVLAGVDINTIRAWLGHVSISTTNIYAEIDLTLKANAVALCEVGQPRPARSWKEDKDLMAFLKAL